MPYLFPAGTLALTGSVAGAPTAHQALSDGLDASSVVCPSGQGSFLGPLSMPEVVVDPQLGVTLRVKTFLEGGSPQSALVTAAILESGQMRAIRAFHPSGALGGGWADFPLTPEEASSIVTWGGLTLQLDSDSMVPAPGPTVSLIEARLEFNGAAPPAVRTRHLTLLGAG